MNLRNFTTARVALGRTGNAPPLRETLAFQLAHARARDAVNHPFNAAALATEVNGTILQSAARTREEYLRRPDRGRRLSPDSITQLEVLKDTRATAASAAHPLGRDNTDKLPHHLPELPVHAGIAAFSEYNSTHPTAQLILADGLSSQATERHALPLLRALIPLLPDWTLPPPVIVERGRVAIGDEIGQILHADAVVVLIGERPGLSSPDSLGIYLTWAPRIGRTDAERNCISNVRPEGLATGAAAQLLAILLNSARQLGLSGVKLKPPASLVS